MVAIRSEHDTQNRTIQGQKSALDGIISELGSLRFMGKDVDVASVVPSPQASPAPEGNGADVADDVAETGPASIDAGVIDEKEEGEEDKPPSSTPGTVAGEPTEDDIEMGEVEENPKNGKGKKKLREELEEGEASDTSSALSDPPDDDD
jgi:THO complex subunit 7